jgi:hypothetical protein
LKNFLIIAAGGAAGHFMRNLVLSSNDTDWPLSTSRYETIINQYPDYLRENLMFGWLAIEQKYSFWKEHYGISLLATADYEQYLKSNINLEKPIVFLNHSFVWGKNLHDLENFHNNTTMLYICPKTRQGLEWQMRCIHYKAKDWVIDPARNDGRLLNDWCFSEPNR